MLKEKSAHLDAAYNQHAPEAAGPRRYPELDQEFTAFCADSILTERGPRRPRPWRTPGAMKEKEALLRKADWLRQFKATLIQDINAADTRAAG